VHEYATKLATNKACIKEVEDGDGGGWHNCMKMKIITPLTIIDFFGGSIG
jgi:hypothetical protein